MNFFTSLIAMCTTHHHRGYICPLPVAEPVSQADSSERLLWIYYIYSIYYLFHCSYTNSLLQSLHHSTDFLTYPFISCFIIKLKNPFSIYQHFSYFRVKDQHPQSCLNHGELSAQTFTQTFPKMASAPKMFQASKGGAQPLYQYQLTQKGLLYSNYLEYSYDDPYRQFPLFTIFCTQLLQRHKPEYRQLLSPKHCFQIW